ncbi:LysE family translocator [bacterium]|nr:LysE family translocator [bacterium]
MNFSGLAPFFLLAMTGMITPGPNNLMIMYSGLNFGLRRSLPAFLGILIGGPILLQLIGNGVGMLFVAYPFLKLLIKILGSFYILFLAWKIGRMSDVRGKEQATPITFLAALAFQWVNPKVWILFLTYICIFHVTDVVWLNTLALAGCVMVLNLPALCVWLGLGRVLEGIIHNKRQIKILNRVLAVILVLSVGLLWK